MQFKSAVGGTVTGSVTFKDTETGWYYTVLLFLIMLLRTFYFIFITIFVYEDTISHRLMFYHVVSSHIVSYLFVYLIL